MHTIIMHTIVSKMFRDRSLKSAVNASEVTLVKKKKKKKKKVLREHNIIMHGSLMAQTP